MPLSPMVLNIYGNENEVVKTISRTFVPWKMLKEAVKLQKTLDKENLSEEDIDAIGKFMIVVFGGQFTLEELDQADLGEMLAVLQQIMNIAKGGLSQNPTPPGK